MAIIIKIILFQSPVTIIITIANLTFIIFIITTNSTSASVIWDCTLNYY